MIPWQQYFAKVIRQYGSTHTTIHTKCCAVLCRPQGFLGSRRSVNRLSVFAVFYIVSDFLLWDEMLLLSELGWFGSQGKLIPVGSDRKLWVNSYRSASKRGKFDILYFPRSLHSCWYKLFMVHCTALGASITVSSSAFDQGLFSMLMSELNIFWWSNIVMLPSETNFSRDQREKDRQTGRQREWWYESKEERTVRNRNVFFCTTEPFQTKYAF